MRGDLIEKRDPANAQRKRPTCFPCAVYGADTDYSTNIVRDNVVTGNNTGILETHQDGGKAAQYSNNSCTNGCQVNAF